MHNNIMKILVRVEKATEVCQERSKWWFMLSAFRLGDRYDVTCVYVLIKIKNIQ